MSRFDDRKESTGSVLEFALPVADQVGLTRGSRAELTQVAADVDDDAPRIDTFHGDVRIANTAPLAHRILVAVP